MKIRCSILVGFVSLIGLLAVSPLFGQSGFNFNTFSSVDGLTLNGSTAQIGNILRLTNSTNTSTQGQAGSVWFSTQQPVQGGFTTSFEFRLQDAPSLPHPSDGFAFVVQNSGPPALGQPGGYLGYTGVANSLAVEFDTYQNSEWDPNGNHVAVQSCGLAPNTSIHNPPGCALGINPSLPFILNDRNVHRALIHYVPGTLTVSLDGTTVLTVAIDLASKLSLHNGSAWVGFTAGTGCCAADQDILSWSFTTGCRANIMPPAPFYQSGPSPTVPVYFGYPMMNLKYLNGCLTKDYGCALTTTATALSTFDRWRGIATPAWLDARLKDLLVPGYDQDPDAGNWCDLDFGLIPSVVGKTIDFQKSGAIANIDSYLDEHFCKNNERVILRLNETKIGDPSDAFMTKNSSHFVLVTEKITTASGQTDWKVFDPGWRTADPPDHLLTLSGHLNGGFLTLVPPNLTLRQFTLGDARSFKETPLASAAISLTALSPIELLITDPQGNQLGSLAPGSDIFEIPNGSYFRDFAVVNDAENTEPVGDLTGKKTAYILGPQNGSYRVDAAGTTLGVYTLRFRTIAANGAVQQTAASGLANTGSVTSYEVTYSSMPGQQPVLHITLFATFESTLADINNSLRLGLIDNRGVANSLSQKIQAAQSVTGPARNNVLNAFKNEVNAQTSMHITGIATQVLLKDAESLISQNH